MPSIPNWPSACSASTSWVYLYGQTCSASHEGTAIGVVINIASGQGDRTARGVPIYGPIKAANILQAMQWAVEYARQGIRVVSLSPGAIETPLVKASLAAQGGADALAIATRSAASATS